MKRTAVIMPEQATEVLAEPCVELLEQLVGLESHLSVRFVFAIPKSFPQEPLETLSDEVASRIREVNWEHGTRSDYAKAFSIALPSYIDVLQRPVDIGGYDLLDCDSWIIVESTRFPVAPIRPTFLLKLFCSERFADVEGMRVAGVDFASSCWRFIQSVRLAEKVFVPGSVSAKQVRDMCGVASNHVIELPFWGNPSPSGDRTNPEDQLNNRGGFLWPLDPNQIPRHKSTFFDLEYYFSLGGCEDCIVLLPDSEERLSQHLPFGDFLATLRGSIWSSRFKFRRVPELKLVKTAWNVVLCDSVANPPLIGWLYTSVNTVVIGNNPAFCEYLERLGAQSVFVEFERKGDLANYLYEFDRRLSDIRNRVSENTAARDLRQSVLPLLSTAFGNAIS
jgi:hypothetical protein